MCKRVHERGCCNCDIFRTKIHIYFQSEDILSGLHNFTGPVEVYDLILRSRFGLGQRVR